MQIWSEELNRSDYYTDRIIVLLGSILKFTHHLISCRLGDGDEVVGLEIEFQILAVGSFGDFIFRLFAAKSPHFAGTLRGDRN